MSNPVIEYLRQQIGKPIEESPSAVSRWLKGTLLEIDEGRLVAEFEVRNEMTNPAGMLHGGSIALILDDMIGATVYILDQKNLFVSVNLNLDFLSSAKQGDTVKAETQIVRKGQTMINAEAKLYAQNGRLLAKASSNLVKTGKIKQ